MTEKNNIPSQPRDIMHYESDIWAILIFSKHREEVK